MKTILQYSEDGGISDPYKYCGDLRLKDSKNFSITPLSSRGWKNEPIRAGYRVEIKTTFLQINSAFDGERSQYYFRIVDTVNKKYIAIGKRDYLLDWDGKPQIHDVIYYDLLLSFFIKVSEFVLYTTWVNLPESEGGIIIQDDDIYIE